jgi:uncharacterized protein YgiM (DUF1202 family)
MKRSLVFLLVLGILSCGAVGLAAAENASVTGDGVRIREAPGTTGTVIGSVNKGTRLEVTGKTSLAETVDGHPDSWYAVLYQGKKGYIFGWFLAFDAGAVVGAEGAPAPQVPTLTTVTARPEDIVGDWASYGETPPVIYTFEEDGSARYLSLEWNLDMAATGHRVSRKYLTADLVRGSYTIEGSTVRVAWYWGGKTESLFTVQKEKDGMTLVIDGKQIGSRFHTREPGATPIGDIVVNTEPDL